MELLVHDQITNLARPNTFIFHPIDGEFTSAKDVRDDSFTSCTDVTSLTAPPTFN